MKISEVIKKRMDEMHVTADDVALACEVNRATVYRWLNGEIDNMKRSNIASLARYLQLDPVEIVGSESDDSVTEIPMDSIVFDDYFPLHYCTNLSAGSFDEILDAEPDAVVYVPIKFQGRRKKLLAFQVNGTSMNNVIEDGSIVVVENTSNDGINYKDGTIIVAYCDGLVTVKRLYRQPDGNITLAPDSSDKTHLPIMINTAEQQLVIIGNVLWHMNPDDIAEKKY